MTKVPALNADPGSPPCGIPAHVVPNLVGGLCFVAVLAIDPHPAHGANHTDAPDSPAQTKVQRVPDTWDVTATDDSIYFDDGSSAIDRVASEVLRRHAAKLKAIPGLQVTLIAHTSDLGSSSLELARGQARLEAVQKCLEDLKVPLARIRLENHGSERQGSPTCATEDCAGKSRRVDVLFHR